MKKIQCLKNAFRVLTFMSTRNESTTVEVAKAIGVPRPTSYRILETLTSDGYLEKQADCGLYRITRKVQGLSVGFRKRDLLLEVAKPMVYERGQELGWPLAIYTPRDDVMIARINTDYECAVALNRYRVGFEISMLDSTIGFCYLAYCDKSERERLLKQFSEKWATDGVCTVTEGRHLIANDRHGYWDKFNNRRMDEIVRVINIVRKQRFCNIEVKERREGNLGVPLFLDSEPIGGIVMRYIKSALKDSGRLQSYYEPRLRRLSLDIDDAYNARLQNSKSAYWPSWPIDSNLAPEQFGQETRLTSKPTIARADH